MKIVLVDQMSGMTPYFLQQNPIGFDALCEQVELVREQGKTSRSTIRLAQVLHVDENNFRLPSNTVAFKAGLDGMTEVWKTRQ